MTTRFLILTIAISSLLWGCKTDSIEDLIIANAITAQSVVYSPNSLEVLEGNSSNSNAPTISPSDSYTFGVSTFPSSSKITIDSRGVISFDNTLETGSYSVSVTLTNIAGDRTFENVFDITVTNTVTAPSALSYSTDSIGTPSGVAYTSPSPSVSGTAPFTHSIVNTPSTDAITISSSTGEITASSSLSLGTYNVDVTVSNSADSDTFTRALIITSADVATYTNDVLPIIQAKCTSCHVSGVSQTDYSNYDNAKSGANEILSRVSSGSMPQGRAPLSATEIANIQEWIENGLFE